MRQGDDKSGQMTDAGTASPTGDNRTVGIDMEAALAQALRAAFAPITNEPLPHRFVDLLAKLASEDAGQ